MLVNVLELVSVEDWDAPSRTAALTAVRALPASALQGAVDSAAFDRYSGSLREVSRGIRELVLSSSRPDQALLTVLYFKLLANPDGPVRFSMVDAAYEFITAMSLLVQR